LVLSLAMHDAELGPGQLFAARFEIGDLLVRTSIGNAYRSYDRDLDETVSLLVTREGDRGDTDLELLRDQVRLARKVTHRNITRIYDMAEHEGRHYMTVEYVDGIRLERWLEGLPRASALLDVAAQIAEGLAAAHAVGVLHCNVAPVNVMVDLDGRAVLGNFGLARFEAAETLAGGDQGPDPFSPTVAYLAPEQVRGQAASAASDVYALGLVIYEMWMQRPRYTDANPAAVAAARLDDPLDDLRAGPGLDARIPGGLAVVLGECLAADPAERPPAAVLAERLRELALDASVTGESGEAAAPVEPLTSARHDSLAVLPFRFRGPRESDYLAEALVDELVDLLSQTRGLRVFGVGSTARFTEASTRDPKLVGEELGVDVIVDGTVLLAGDRLRISARLIEVKDGFQLWHERFEGCFADVFELQDRLAKRIAEALRVELDIIAHRESVEPEAVEHYLRGRQAHLRWIMFGPEGALAHYRAALARAPTFKPALAHLAAASVLAWFQPHEHDDIDWEREAEQAVARAMEHAAGLPETRLAASNLAAQRGDHGEAARHLREALDVAPTFALAHEFFGRISLEAGRVDDGLHHLLLAVDLDPALGYCLADVARYYALIGDLDQFHAHAGRLVELLEFHRPSTGMLHIRVGGWIGDADLIRTGLEHLGADSPRVVGLRSFGETLLEPPSDQAIQIHYIRSLSVANSPRLKTLVEQLIAEASAYHGFDERALDHLERASGYGLADLVWLDYCPLFEAIRGHPRFVAVRAAVVRRCDQVHAALT